MTTWPDLTALEVLVGIAEHGSVGAAARAVGMAQPNASRSLARLERHLGLSLVTRTTHGSRLTPAGLVVVDWARPMLAAGRNLLDGAARLARPDTPQSVAVAASKTVAEHLLPIWLSHLRLEHPSASIDVLVHNSTEVIDDVLEGEAAVGFVESPGVPRGVHHAVVGRDDLLLVVPPDHPWARRRRPVDAAELGSTPLVVRESGSGTRVALDRALGKHGPAVPAQELGSNAAVRVAVTSGAAPAVLSRLAVADQLATGALVQVPLADLPLRRRLRAVWTGPRRLDGVPSALVNIARSATINASR